METLEFNITIECKLTAEQKTRIFEETGMLKALVIYSFKLSDPEYKMFRKHFLDIVTKNLSNAYSVSLDDIDNLEMTPEELYETWLSQMHHRHLFKYEKLGTLCSPKWNPLEEHLLGIVTDEEREKAIAIGTLEKERQDALNLAKIEEAKKAHAATLEAQRQQEEAKKKKIKEEKKQREIKPPTYTLNLSEDATTNNPIEWLEKNWACIILARDPHAPGGLQRSFFEKARGNNFFFIIPPGTLDEGMMLEFGSTKGSRTLKKHFVVLEVLDTKIVLAECTDENHMFRFRQYWETNLANDAKERSKRFLNKVMEQADLFCKMLSTLDDRGKSLAIEYMGVQVVKLNSEVAVA